MKRTQKTLSVGLLIILLLLTGCSPSAKVTELLQEENYDEAVEQYNSIEEPDESIEASFIEKINEIYEGFKNNIIEYTTATAIINSISKISNTSVRTVCTNTQKKIDVLNDSRTAFDTAVAFEKAKNYSKAIEQFSLVIEEDENFQIAVEKITSCSNDLRKEAISAAEEFIKNNDYESALKTLKDTLKDLPNDKDITLSITVYTEAYVSIIIDQVDELIKEKKYDEAEVILKDALRIVPNNEIINDNLKEIDSIRPVGLEIVHVIDSNGYEYRETAFTDSFGNKFDAVHYFMNREANADFNLNGEYTRFTGAIVADEATFKDGIYSMYIYADKKLLKSVKGYTKRTGRIDFNLDVTGCKVLSVKMYHEQITTSTNENLGIVDAVLEKI